MNVLKKFAVSLTALTTLGTLGIGSFSVSANGLTTAEDKFIASYKNADEIKAANYYLENGLSVEEAQELMDTYIDGKEKLEAKNNPKSRAIPTGVNFYSDTNLSDNQHYGVVIANNGSACSTVTLTLGYQPSWVGFNSSLSQRMLDDSSNFSFTHIANRNLISVGGTYVGNETSEIPSAVFEVPFNVVMTEESNVSEAYSEGTLYHKFAFTRASSTPIVGDSTFCFETYVRGDVNHDGIVDSLDVYYLTEYNLHNITDLSFTYTDKNNNIANIINNLAADTDKDGYIGVPDLTWIQKNIG